MELTAFAFKIKDGVAHITMNQPERGNPLDSRFAEEFNWLATECTVRPTVRSVLIDATGRFFSVGGDLNGDVPVAVLRRGAVRPVRSRPRDRIFLLLHRRQVSK